MPPTAPIAEPAPELDPDALKEQYMRVRSWSEALCKPLTTEDYVVQSMPDASPAKWHLAHTSWFFEKFLLEPGIPGYDSPHPQYDFLFNSYYNSLGARHCRPKRGLISRPSVAETYTYRAHVDRAMATLLSKSYGSNLSKLGPLLQLGLNHEQQHQELIAADLKHMLSENPLQPVYRSADSAQPAGEPASGSWCGFDGGLCEIGYCGAGFSFDNETPRHKVYARPFALGSRLVTNAEYAEFIEAGGYRRPQYWLSEGWAIVQARGWEAPLYWERARDRRRIFTLHGIAELQPHEPVCHVSLFEADAFAHWKGARLPTEAEWEIAAEFSSAPGVFAESELFHPQPARRGEPTGPVQMLGDVWEWTRSQYEPYPGYRQAEGALGEYNGKFMCNQFVLRGGSCATPLTHIRRSYRNFFPPDARWQFTGIRLAKDE